MSTKFMKLGFKPIRNYDIHNIVVNEQKIGYTFNFHLNYYRGIHLSAITSFEIWVDGKKVEDFIIGLNGKKFVPEQLPYLFSEFWSVKSPMQIEVFNQSGLSSGEHSLEISLFCICAYMQFAPRMYAQFDNSDKATMIVKEGITL